MPSSNIHTLVDWSYTQDPVGYLRELSRKDGWYQAVMPSFDEFMMLKFRYNEFNITTSTYSVRYEFNAEGDEMLGMVTSTSSMYSNLQSVRSSVYYYSLHDVLNPNMGVITYLPKPEKQYHELSPIRPVMAIQSAGDKLFVQWDNLIITSAAGYDVDALVRSRNYGASTIDTTGQIDELRPPGYNTSVTDYGVYIVSWDEILVDGVKSYKLRWSNGTQTITQSNPITGADKDKVYTVQETVKSVNVSYEEDGSKNTSTTNIFLQTSATPDKCMASSTLAGSSPIEAFKGESGSGWVSADGDTTNVWLAYDFGSAGAVLNKWRFMGHKTIPNCGPKKFRIDATNSAAMTNWDTLYSEYENKSYRSLGRGEWSDWFTFSNGISYRFYRLYILESYADG